MSIKKLFPENEESKKGLAEFFNKRGFYIVLILCVAIVGATAVFVTTHNITSSNTDFDANKLIPEEASSVAQGTAEAKPAAQSSVAVNDKAPVANAEAKNTKAVSAAAAQTGSAKQTAPAKETKTASANKASTKTPAPSTSKPQSFIKPVFGEVTFSYSRDKLVFSKTLDEWRTHSGIDLAADRGTSVKAVADGVVSGIKSDPRFGITVIIDHKNGMKTVYSNLASDDMVAPNQRIKQGDVIGSVGSTAAFESAEQSHLHFEVWKNNEAVNPAELLPKK